VVDQVAALARPGGAGLAAKLAAGDGPSTTLITAFGQDAAGRQLQKLLAAAGVEVIDLGLDGATPEKVRIWAADRAVLRLDRGGSPPAVCGRRGQEVHAAIARADAVLVADYGRGVTASTDVRRMLLGACGRLPVVWDPHPRGAPPVRGARLVTPNDSETAGFAPQAGAAGLALHTARARTLRRRWEAASIAVTLGAAGALFVDGDATPLVIPTAAVEGDRCGAGDRFAATAAILLAGGALPSEAVTAAVARATAFVASGGARAFTSRSGVPATPIAVADRSSTAMDIAHATKTGGGRVVVAGGCFDLLHKGHVCMLEAASRLGDCLIVALNSDRSVGRLKGPDRPVVPEQDRAAVLRGLGCVDGVEIFDDDTPLAVLERLRPDVYAKGADYSIGELPEAKLVARWGGQAVVVPYIAGFSTSRLVEEVERRGSW
jgi:rfaE bifunctional protein nucleotidyltransferase chain/domain